MTFGAALPKAELHLHIEGTMEPELAFALAERNGLPAPAPSVEALRARYAFTSLQSFLDVYYANMAVLRTARDFHDLAAAYLRRCPEQGVRHAEIFFDPQPHLARGVPMADILDGLTSAIDEAARDGAGGGADGGPDGGAGGGPGGGAAGRGVSAGLIMCFLRDESAESAERTLRLAEPYADRLLGVGLDSAEAGHPPAKFATVFARARELGLRVVAHAGEEGPAAYVREALDVLGAERIDHGVRSLEDPELVARLRADRVPLTVCPLSNVRLGVVPGLDAHPLPRMLAEGLMVTVNSDDPAYFGGYAGDNYTACAAALGLDTEDLRRLAATSFEASFLPRHRKDELLAELTTWTP